MARTSPLRVERNDRAGTRTEGLFGDELQVIVNAELNLFAGDGFLLGKPHVLHFFADAVYDHAAFAVRSEEHTSELQSRLHLVCRLLLEKKKNTSTTAQPALLS